MTPDARNIEEVIKRIDQIPPLSQVVQRALSLIRDPKSNMGDIGSVLSMDPVMASKVLRLANSAYYALPFPIPTVQQAVVYLGQSTILSLIMTASVATYLYRPLPGYGLDKGELWKHSIGVAAGARLVAEPFGKEFAEEAYNAGLLCDIGKLVIEGLLRDMDLSDERLTNLSFAEIEETVIGCDHATLGGEIAKRWRLPPSFIAAITYHHKPSQAKQHTMLASAIHIADAAMMMMGIGIGRDGLNYELDTQAFEQMGWDGTRLFGLFLRVNDLIQMAELSMGIKSDPTA